MILGVGTDVVDLDRFEATLERTPTVRERLFTPAEATLPLASLAARFAAKEALAKALGAPPGLKWTDATVAHGEHGAPGLAVRGTVARRAEALGVTHWHVSLTHDGGIASAVVIAESSPFPHRAVPRRGECHP